MSFYLSEYLTRLPRSGGMGPSPITRRQTCEAVTAAGNITVINYQVIKSDGIVTLSYWLGSSRATEAVTHTMGVVTGEWTGVVTLLTLLECWELTDVTIIY